MMVNGLTIDDIAQQFSSGKYINGIYFTTYKLTIHLKMMAGYLPIQLPIEKYGYIQEDTYDQWLVMVYILDKCCSELY